MIFQFFPLKLVLFHRFLLTFTRPVFTQLTRPDLRVTISRFRWDLCRQWPARLGDRFDGGEDGSGELATWRTFFCAAQWFRTHNYKYIQYIDLYIDIYVYLYIYICIYVKKTVHIPYMICKPYNPNRYIYIYITIFVYIYICMIRYNPVGIFHLRNVRCRSK